MKILLRFIIFINIGIAYSQNSNSSYASARPINYSYISYFPSDIEIKSAAKEISQFRAKEFIINNIIGDNKGKEIKFETESLASDDSGGLISVAFNCNEVSKKGLLLAFIGYNKNQNGEILRGYGFRDIPLNDAKELLSRIEAVRETNKKYLSNDTNVNNVYIEYQDIKFVIYKDFGSKIRVFWNGFEVIWEDTAFNRSKRRLDKWFND